MNLNKFTGKMCDKLLSVAVFSIILVIFIIIVDVTLRVLRMPIAWGYELVILIGTIAMGLSLPYTTFKKTHVILDFGIEAFPKSWHIILIVITRCLGIVTFTVFTWMSFLYGNSLWKSGEVSAYMHLPYAIGPYIMGFSCFIVCIVLLNDLSQSLIRRS